MATTTRLMAATLFLLVLVAMQCASAAVSERDLLNADDRLLTYDDINHREWLDLSYTYRTDLDLIQASMQPSEFLAGFQFATVEDVHGLNLSAGYGPRSQLNIEQLSIDELIGTDQLVDYLGFIEPEVTGHIVEFTIGQVAVGFDAGHPVFDDTNVVLLNNPTFNFVFDNMDPYDLIYAHITLVPPEEYVENRMVVTHPDNPAAFPALGFPGNFFAPSLAVGDKGPFWLYREVVPEPTTIGLLLSGITLLFTSRRQHAPFVE